jgi:hypothetical protein
MQGEPHSLGNGDVIIFILRDLFLPAYEVANRSFTLKKSINAILSRSLYPVSPKASEDD